MRADGEPSGPIPGAAPVEYAYDAANRLVQLVQGGQTVTLEYDAAERRTRLRLPNPVWIPYGLYLAGREAYCLQQCLRTTCAY